MIIDSFKLFDLCNLHIVGFKVVKIINQYIKVWLQSLESVFYVFFFFFIHHWMLF